MNNELSRAKRRSRMLGQVLPGLAVLSVGALHTAQVEAQETPIDCLMSNPAGIPVGPIPTEAGTGYVAETCITADGRNGTPFCAEPPFREYDQPYTYPGTCAPSEALITSGRVSPKYMILGVVYAPPGSQDCKDNSSIVYDNDSSVETTIDTSQSFKDSHKVAAEVSAGVAMVAMGSVGGSVAQGESNTNSQGMVFKTNLSTMSTVPGPCYDGINHDWDQILVLLDPIVSVRVSDPVGCATCSAELDNTTWSITPSGTTLAIYAGELKGTLQMQDSTSRSIAAHGLTQDELNHILAADPLAWWSPDETADPDPGRFVRAFGVGTIPYVAPLPGNPGTAITKIMRGMVTTKDAQARSFDTTVGLNASLDVAFLTFVNLKLKAESSWTWTNSNSSALSDTESEGATLTIGSPSANYYGPNTIAVYYDTLFKTYAFVGKI